jgi:hypothetical protein
LRHFDDIQNRRSATGQTQYVFTLILSADACKPEFPHAGKFDALQKCDSAAAHSNPTRSRRSRTFEYGFGIAWTPKDESVTPDSRTDKPFGNPFDSSQPEHALV